MTNAMKMARGVSLAWLCRMVADDIVLACSVLLNIKSCASDMPARYIASPSELFSLANWNAAPISPSNARLTSPPLLKSLKFETLLKSLKFETCRIYSFGSICCCNLEV